MTKDEFKKIIKKVRFMYPNQPFISDAETFETWFSMLENENADFIDYSIREHFKNSAFPPRVSEVIEGCKAIREKQDHIRGMVRWNVNKSMVIYPGNTSLNQCDKYTDEFIKRAKAAKLKNDAIVYQSVVFSMDINGLIERMEKKEVEYMNFDEAFERWTDKWGRQKNEH